MVIWGGGMGCEVLEAGGGGVRGWGRDLDQTVVHVDGLWRLREEERTRERRSFKNRKGEQWE